MAKPKTPLILSPSRWKSHLYKTKGTREDSSEWFEEEKKIRKEE